MMLAVMAAATHAESHRQNPDRRRLDTPLQQRAEQLTGSSRVIVEFRGTPDVGAITGRGGIPGRRLGLVRAQAAEIANNRLASLASDPRIARVTIDRPAFATLQRTGLTAGALAVHDNLGLTGRGVGIALIDSGVSGWHDDLHQDVDAPISRAAARVVHFKDFVRLLPAGSYATEFPYDDYGHGTHVAGILAGSGYASSGARKGVAPGARIVGLKVLDSRGSGYISDVIAAIEYAISVKDAYNIRVINLSVGSGVFESYETDPLALAARRAVEAGIVVVAASGNFGRNANGMAQYGGITSPGNAPWVLTVGASNHQGTTRRGDDTIGAFSSRGPTWIDFAAKPDILAPGVGVESLAEAWSTLYARYSGYLVAGSSGPAGYRPYLSLSGTSMAAPVVSGAIALMLEANPALTPNAVKAILQYTAQTREGHDILTQGAGILNASGAVRLARYWANPQAGLGEMGDVIGGERANWSGRLLWGNFHVGGGVPLPGANAWTTGLTWGALTGLAGERIVWGTEDVDNIVWSLVDDNIVWSLSQDDERVWSLDDNIVWSLLDENIVWSLHNATNVVWSLDCGGANCQSVVWGSRAPDGTLWGTASEDQNIVWSLLDENIVWSLMDENIVWSLSAVEPTLWERTASSPVRERGRRPRRR